MKAFKVPYKAKRTSTGTKWTTNLLKSNRIKEVDTVNNPPHYNQSSIECIDAIDAATVDLKGIEAVCTGNAIKYLWRWKNKGGKEDLWKARWYINKLLTKLNG